MNTHLNQHLKCHQQQHPYHDPHTTVQASQTFALHHYNHHLYHHLHHPTPNKPHRRINLPQIHAGPFGRPHLLGEDEVPAHHTIDMMDTTMQADVMASPVGLKSHSGPTSLFNVLSNVSDHTRVSCKVKVEPLLDTFLTATATTTAGSSQDSELSSGTPCYGTL